MSTIVTMTLDEIMRTPLTEEEIRTIRAGAKKKPADSVEATGEE